jgi:hypothetical protein
MSDPEWLTPTTSTVGQLARAAVVGGMDLGDPPIELRGEGRNPRPLERPGGDDHLAGVVGHLADLADLDDIAVREPASEGGGAAAWLDRQTEMIGVCLQVIGHLAARREPGADVGERQAWQGIVLGRRIEQERVVAVAPHIAHSVVRLENHEFAVLAREVVAGGEARLSGSDDDCVEAFGHDPRA